jgi:hypothetical protein
MHAGMGDPVPIRERKPCVVYKLPKAAVSQVVRFLFGDGRFPRVSAKAVDAQESVSGATLSDEGAAIVTKWIGNAIETASVKPLIRELAKTGISSRTAVVVLEIIDGRFDFTQPEPQHCYAAFRNGDPDFEVIRLLWVYEFRREEVAPDGKTLITKRYLFRREWDDRFVSFYDSVELKQGEQPEWGAPQQVEHGFDFCPVVWIRNETSAASGVDGVSLYDGCEEQIEALDITLSRRHQGLVYLGSPQVYETGVEDGDGPGATGRKSAATGFSGRAPHGMVAAPARKAGPEVIWQYNGKDVTIGMLETTGKAFEVATAHASDLRSRFLEEIGVVLASMADTVSRITAGAEMSAKFLALAHAPLIGLVQEYRDTWWPMGLRKLLEMMLRMTASVEDRGERVLIPGSSQMAAQLQAFMLPTWVAPQLEAKWGAFFSPSTSETQATVASTAQAKSEGLISRQTAVEAVAHDFGIDDVETELDEIAVEAAERQANALLADAQRNAATHDMLRGLDAEADDSGQSRQGVRRGPRGNAETRGRGRGSPEGDDSSINRPVTRS